MSDGWTPLLKELEAKLSPAGREELLFQMINEIRFITQQNFGEDGAHRANEWQLLARHYAEEFHDGNRVPSLILTGEMLQSFQTTVSADEASLTNTAEYADQHMPITLAKNKDSRIPARNPYPVSDSGELTPYAQARLNQVVNDFFLRTL